MQTRKGNPSQLVCDYCGAVKKEISFFIGASIKADWCMIEGTGKMTCPACYDKAIAEGRAAIDKHVQSAKEETMYNGWKNRQTWNVALWLGNDEGLYNMARGYAEYEEPYKQLAAELRTAGVTETPDGVAYNDPDLDIAALDDMMREQAS